MSPNTDVAEKPATKAGPKRSGTASKLPRLVALGVAVVLLIAMAFSTKWLTPEEEAALIPEKFNAATFAAEAFSEITDKVKANAVDITELAPAVASNMNTAGKQYGVDSGGKYTVPVKITAPVESVDANFITLSTPEIEGFVVRIPIAAALNGTAVRDVTGEYTFGDFIDQTAYQAVANELKLVMQRRIIDPLDKATLPGKTVTVYGAWVTGGQPGTFVIQPLQLEVQG